MNKKKNDNKYKYSKNFKGIRTRQLTKKDEEGNIDIAYEVSFRNPITKRSQTIMVGKKSEGMTPKIAMKAKEELIKTGDVQKIKNLLNNKSIVSTNEPATIEELWNDYCNDNKDKEHTKKLEYQFSMIKSFHRIQAKDITSKMVEDFRRTLEKKKNTKGQYYKPATVRHILGLLKMLINYGHNKHYYIKNKFLSFKMPQVHNEVTETLTKEEVTRYLTALYKEKDKDPYGFVYILTAFYTGMRKSAILKLLWTDIDFEHKSIFLRAENAKNSTNSYIPLPEIIIEPLKSLVRVNEYVFPGKKGGHRESFTRFARKLRVAAGLPNSHRPLHMLRHNFASHLVSNGVSLFEVQNLLTHKDIKMTQRYAHLSQERLISISDMYQTTINNIINENTKN